MNSVPPEPTLRDIAKAVGVSHATVSRALHDNPRISAALRLKIHAAARRMGYRPNPMATALANQRRAAPAGIHSAIAWLNFWEDPAQLRRYCEFDLYWRGASETAEQAGFRLDEFPCHGGFSAARVADILEARGIRGLLIPPHRGLPAAWRNFQWERFHAIRFGYSMPVPGIPVVTSDQLYNGMIAFQNLRRLGYARIGFVTSQEPSTRFRAGFLMEQLDLPPAERLPVLMLPIMLDSRVDTRPLPAWLKKNRPDAILTDIREMRVMLARAGHRVPEDIGLAAMSVLDGDADAGIYQNSEEIGIAAMEQIISLMNHNHVTFPTVQREHLIAGRWVDGASLPPRPGA